MTTRTRDLPASGDDGRILEVDGLRGAALLLVLLWHHVVELSKAPHRSVLSGVLVSLRLSWSGVDLFFVLSGFLIGGILLDARDRTSYFGTFYKRRFFRIVPLYTLVYLAYEGAVLAGGVHWRGDAGRWLFADPIPWYAFPVFLQNVFMAVRGSFDPFVQGVMWSLAVEEQFYLTLPLLVRFLSRKQLVRVLAVSALAAPVLRAAAFHLAPHGGLVAFILTPMRADALLGGVFVALLLRTPSAWARVEQRRASLKIAALVLVLAALCATAVGATGSSSALMTIGGYSGLALFYALVLVLTLSNRSGRLSRLLRMRWLRAVGGIAYGAYLLHIGVLGVCFGLFFGRAPRVTSFADLAVTLFALVVSLALAQLSWTFFEKPLVRFGHRYRYGDPIGAPAAAVAPDRDGLARS